MSDGVPFAEYEARCSHCSAKLVVQGGVTEPQGERLVCPTHGDQGSVQEFREMVEDRAQQDVGDALRDMFKRAGFDPQ